MPYTCKLSLGTALTRVSFIFLQLAPQFFKETAVAVLEGAVANPQALGGPPDGLVLPIDCF